MQKDHYVYPALFRYTDEGISVSYPSLPGCLTCADTTEEALYMAKDALQLHLYSMEEDNEEIPVPSDLVDLKVAENERLIFVDVFMPPFRDSMENKSIKKTLTIPKWLNDEAEKEKVNFSAILQAGLKQSLGIAEFKRP